ncbi:MAG: glycosyltransferase family 39 protein [Anaerolineae bacterium]
MLVNRRWWLLALIVLLALALRLINLGVRNLWYDEAFAVLFSEKGLDAMVYGTLTPVTGGAADIHPLLYYTALNIWMAIFGQSPFYVRLLSVVLGVATVAVVFMLADELFGNKTALLAAFITAIAPFHVQYSQETRMYTMLGLLLTVASWCFVKGWRAGNNPEQNLLLRLRYWLAFGVLAGLAMYTQQLAAFYLVALGLIPFLARRPVQIANFLIGTVVAVIVYLPWLVNLPGQFQKVRSYYWLEPPTIGTPFLTIRSFMSVNLDFPAPASTIALLGAVFMIVFFGVQFVMWIQNPRNRKERKVLVFVLWLAVMPPVLMWLVSQIQPVYLERSLLPSAVISYIVLAWFFTRSGIPRPIAVALGGVGLVLVVIGLFYQYTWATFPNSPFQSATDFIDARWKDGDVIVHMNKLSTLPMIYYERSLPQRFIGDRPGSGEDTLALPTQETLGIFADSCVQAASRDGQRIWWVVFDFAEKQYAAAKRPEMEQSLSWLNEHFTPEQKQQFNDLDVVLYTNPHGDLSAECQTS